MTQLVSQRRMTVAEFLDWDDGTDTRYELVDGFPVAQAAPILAHALVVTNIAAGLHRQLRPPCQAFVAVGVALPGRRRPPTTTGRSGWSTTAPSRAFGKSC